MRVTDLINVYIFMEHLHTPQTIKTLQMEWVLTIHSPLCLSIGWTWCLLSYPWWFYSPQLRATGYHSLPSLDLQLLLWLGMGIHKIECCQARLVCTKFSLIHPMPSTAHFRVQDTRLLVKVLALIRRSRETHTTLGGETLSKEEFLPTNLPLEILLRTQNLKLNPP